jgi:cytochrome c biogenesis protein ResB
VPDYASDVAVVVDGKAQRKATVRVNSPFVHRGVTLYQGTHGFAVRFMFAERKSRKIFNSRVVFKTDLTSEPARYVGSFDVPGTDFSVDAEFFPDAVFEDGKLRTVSPVPRKPAALVTVLRGGVEVFSGPIFRARPVEFEKGVCIGLGMPKYWSEFTVVKDSGVTLVFVGAWIAVAGLCVRFLPLTMKRREREGGA